MGFPVVLSCLKQKTTIMMIIHPTSKRQERVPEEKHSDNPDNCQQAQPEIQFLYLLQNRQNQRKITAKNAFMRDV